MGCSDPVCVRFLNKRVACNRVAAAYCIGTVWSLELETL